MYDIEQTSNYRFQYGKLPLKLRRFVDEATDILKLYPTEYKGRITHLSKHKDKTHWYRFRIPGAYIMYLVNLEEPLVLLSNIKILR